MNKKNGTKFKILASKQMLQIALAQVKENNTA